MGRSETPESLDDGGKHRDSAPRRPPLSRYQRLDFSDLGAIWGDLLNGEESTDDLSETGAGVFTMGSCFAKNLAKKLRDHGVPAGLMPVSEFVNTPMYNLVTMRACAGSDSEKREGRDLVRLARSLENLGTRDADFEHVSVAIAKASCIVFTVGVGFLWRLKETREIVLAPDTRQWKKYESHFPTSGEQMSYLREIVKLIRKTNGKATIWFTLSPVPLEITTAYASAIVGDCVSKSILRDAVHLLMLERIPNVRYFPSFEFVRWCGGHLQRSMYGADGKVRHVDDDVVDIIVSKFLSINGYRFGTSVQT